MCGCGAFCVSVHRVCLFFGVYFCVRATVVCEIPKRYPQFVTLARVEYVSSEVNVVSRYFGHFIEAFVFVRSNTVALATNKTR